MYICEMDFWRGPHNQRGTVGILQIKRWEATALKLFISQEQKPKAQSKTQMKKLSYGM